MKIDSLAVRCRNISAVAAARAALALSPDEPAAERQVPDRADLLAKVKAATASARRMCAEAAGR